MSVGSNISSHVDEAAVLAVLSSDTPDQAIVKMLVHGGRAIDAVITALGADHPMISDVIAAWSWRIMLFDQQYREAQTIKESR